MEKVEIKKVIEKALGKDYKVVCLTDRKIGYDYYRTWAIICNYTEEVVAVISATDSGIYEIKYCAATALRYIMEIDKALCVNYHKGEKVVFND